MKYENTNGVNESDDSKFPLVSFLIILASCVALLVIICGVGSCYLSCSGIVHLFHSVYMWPHKKWQSVPQRKRLFYMATAVMFMQLSDLVSDLVLLSGIVYLSAVAPYKFCSFDENAGIIAIDTFADWIEAPSYFTFWYFEGSCVTETSPWHDVCLSELGFLCQCKSESYKSVQSELKGIRMYALAVLIAISAKEAFKLVIIMLFFCSSKFHTTTWFKYALNSPFVLLALWAPSVRELASDTMLSELEHEEQAFHILLDVILEDLPQMVIPVWYLVQGETSTIAAVSLTFSGLSLLATLYRVIEGIKWKTNAAMVQAKASMFVSKIRANAGLEMIVPVDDVVIRPVDNKVAVIGSNAVFNDEFEGDTALLIPKLLRKEMEQLLKEELATIKLEVHEKISSRFEAELEDVRKEYKAMQKNTVKKLYKLLQKKQGGEIRPVSSDDSI